MKSSLRFGFMFGGLTLLVLLAGVAVFAVPGSASRSVADTPATVVRGAPIDAGVVRQTERSAPELGSTDNEIAAKPTAGGATDVSKTAAQATAAELVAQSESTRVVAAADPQPETGPFAEGALVPFAVLANYPYDPYLRFDTPPGEEPGEQIPEKIKALNGSVISVEGFMMPIEMRNDVVRTFLLVRNRMMCCFGVQVSMNEWVLVKMRGANGARFYNDVPLRVRGKIEVGEDVQDGMVMSLYRMYADEVLPTGGY